MCPMSPLDGLAAVCLSSILLAKLSCAFGAPCTYTLQQSNDGEMQILINSSLSLNLVSGGSPGTGATAWVLDTRPGGGPVAGAEVILFGETRFQVGDGVENTVP